MIPWIALVGCRSTGILIGIPNIVTAGAPGVMVCPATTYWWALLAVMIWPSTVRVGKLAFTRSSPIVLPPTMTGVAWGARLIRVQSTVIAEAPGTSV